MVVPICSLSGPGVVVKGRMHSDAQLMHKIKPKMLHQTLETQFFENYG